MEYCYFTLPSFPQKYSIFLANTDSQFYPIILYFITVYLFILHI